MNLLTARILAGRELFKVPSRLLMLSFWFRCGVASRAEAFTISASASGEIPKLPRLYGLRDWYWREAPNVLLS